jgi:hypothetical protein
LSYRQFDALLERKNEEFRKQRFCAGIVAAMVANSAMTRGENSKAMTALDFVPEWNKEEELKTDEEMIFSMANFFGCGPGSRPN